MKERMRRPLAVAACVAGALLGAASVTVWTWGLGVLAALALFVAGWVVLTDRRPAHMRAGRPYDRVVDR